MVLQTVINKCKAIKIKRMIIYLLTISMIVVLCFCILVYNEKKSLKHIELLNYIDCTEGTQYKLIDVNNEDADINIKASVNMEDSGMANSSIFIALNDINSGDTFVINTDYDRMFKTSVSEPFNLKDVRFNARCLKSSLQSNHEYNVFIILEDSSSKKYIKTSEVVKC